MDQERFDALTRALSTNPTRRGIAGAAVALVLSRLPGFGVQRARAVDCPSGTVRCGGPGGLPTAECCPFGEKCCVSTGVCCGPNGACFRLPDGDVCKPVCEPNAFRCAGGAGECCPAGQDCCGEGFRLCCGPNDTCFRPGGGQPPFCLRTCDVGQTRCSQSGDCCPFGGTCCGEGNRLCCNEHDICDTNTGGPPTCATPCDIFSRRCATTGVCCSYGQKCCGEECCFPGEVCSQNTRCVKAKKRRKRRRRRRHH